MNLDFSRMREKMTCSEPDLESIRWWWLDYEIRKMTVHYVIHQAWEMIGGVLVGVFAYYTSAFVRNDRQFKHSSLLKTGNYMQCRPLVLNFSYHNLFGLVETALCIPCFISAPPLSVNPRWPPCRPTGLQPEQEYKSSNRPTSPTLNLLFATWTH